MKIQTRYWLVLTVFMITLLGSCRKEDEKNTEPLPATSHTAWVLNEGNFGWGNASIGRLSLDDSLYIPGVFERVNQRPLGDVLQSGLVHQGELYLVLNNSGTIEVLDPIEAKLLRTLRVGESPRYMSPIAHSVDAWVTDLFGGFVRKINLQTGEVKETVLIPGWNEKIYALPSQLQVVMNLSSHALYFIDDLNPGNLDSFKVPDSQMRDMVLSEDGNSLYVCIQTGGQKGVLLQISDRGQAKEIALLDFIPRRLVIRGDDAFCLGSEWIYRIQLSSGQVESWVPIQEGMVPYGLSLDPRGNLWLMDAVDYVQQGKVLVYNQQAQQVAIFNVGAIPREILFVD